MDAIRSVANRRRLKGAKAFRLLNDIGDLVRQLLLNQKAIALIPIISRRWATSDHIPHPITAITTATMPLMSDAIKTILEIRAKRNALVNTTVCTTHNELMGRTKKSTGATVEMTTRS